MWWAAVSRAVDQSSTRNKRDDRLAEGHACVAGAAMVLRMLSDPGLLIGVCHCFFDSLGTFRRGRSLSDRQNEGRCGSRAVRPETSKLSLHYRNKRTDALFGTSQCDSRRCGAVRRGARRG